MSDTAAIKKSTDAVKSAPAFKPGDNGYAWNGSTQELVPLPPEGIESPALDEALQRWNTPERSKYAREQ
jgi:hypothetical protein